MQGPKNVVKGGMFMRTISAAVLFVCAAVMAFMGRQRYRAGMRGRALLDFFMAACMAIFGMGYMGL
jgi:hypothetical protein